MKPNDIFGDYVGKYEEWFKKNNFMLGSEVKAIKELLPTFEKGIEIGVGTGIFASLLGIKEGVEPSIKMAEKAAARGINVVNAKAENLPLNDNSYQLALMVTVDCFLDDISQAFAEVSRILVNGGCFIVAFIDRQTALGQIYERNKASDEFYKYANFHSSGDIAGYLEKAGFAIVDKRQTVYSLQNETQEIKSGHGEGVFAVIKAQKGQGKDN